MSPYVLVLLFGAYGPYLGGAVTIDMPSEAACQSTVNQVMAKKYRDASNWDRVAAFAMCIGREEPKK